MLSFIEFSKPELQDRFLKAYLCEHSRFLSIITTKNLVSVTCFILVPLIFIICSAMPFHFPQSLPPVTPPVTSPSHFPQSFPPNIPGRYFSNGNSEG